MDLAVSTLIFHPEDSFHGPALFSYGAFLPDLVKLSSSREIGIPCSVQITDWEAGGAANGCVTVVYPALVLWRC